MMFNAADFRADQIQIWIAMFVRITAIVALLPVFGASNVPVQIKAGLSLLLASILFPVVAAKGGIVVSQSLPAFVFVCVKELFIGLVIGYAASLLFVSVQLAGDFIDTIMGFSFVQLVDPLTESEVTASGQFQVLIFSIIFLTMNGHLFLLLAIQKCFEVVPLFGGHIPTGAIADHFMQMTANIFVLAFKLASPILIPLIVTTVTLGVVARTVPQLNVFFIGMPLSIAVGFGAMVIALPLMTVLFKKIAEGMLSDVWKLILMLA